MASGSSITITGFVVDTKTWKGTVQGVHFDATQDLWVGTVLWRTSGDFKRMPITAATRDALVTAARDALSPPAPPP